MIPLDPKHRCSPRSFLAGRGRRLGARWLLIQWQWGHAPPLRLAGALARQPNRVTATPRGEKAPVAGLPTPIFVAVNGLGVLIDWGDEGRDLAEASGRGSRLKTPFFDPFSMV